MIQKSQVCLYKKNEDWNRIRIYINKKGEVKTYWGTVHKFIDKRKNILKKLKVNGCAICGYNNCNRALEFHHVNPEYKKFNLGAEAMHKHPLVVAEEISKCILLCSNCHKEIEDMEEIK